MVMAIEADRLENNGAFGGMLVSWVSCLYLVVRGFEEKWSIVSHPASEPEQWNDASGCLPRMLYHKA